MWGYDSTVTKMHRKNQMGGRCVGHSKGPMESRIDRNDFLWTKIQIPNKTTVRRQNA